MLSFRTSPNSQIRKYPFGSTERKPKSKSVNKLIARSINSIAYYTLHTRIDINKEKPRQRWRALKKYL